MTAILDEYGSALPTAKQRSKDSYRKSLKASYERNLRAKYDAAQTTKENE